jgi:signal peptidase I
MWAFIAAFVASLVLVAFTVWALGLTLAIYLGSIVDAGRRYRRLRGSIRWSTIDPLIAFGFSVAASFVLRTYVVEAFRIPSSSMYPTLQIGDHIFVDKLRSHWRSPHRGDLIVFRQPCQPDRDYVSRVIAVENDTVEIRCTIVYVNGTAAARTLVDANASYDDYDESSGRWAAREVSRYRETLDGITHEVFHGPELPMRDDQRRKTVIGGDSKDFPIETPPTCGSSQMTMSQTAATSLPGKLVTTGEPTEQCGRFRHYVVPGGHVFVLGDSRSNSNDSRYWGSVPIDNVKGRVIGIWLPLRRFGAVD